MKLTVECLENLFVNIDASTVLVGDLNFPGINWNTNFSTVNTGLSCDTQFLNFVNSFALTQFVVEPTRPPNLLDLVLSNDPFSVYSVRVCDPFSTSDHCSVEFKILAGSCYETYVKTEYYDYKSADWEKLMDPFASLDWSSVFRNLANEELWNAFHNTIFYYIDLLIHNSGTHCLLYPKFILASLLFQAEHTFPNCFPSLDSFPYSLDCLPGFIVVVFIFYVLSNYT